MNCFGTVWWQAAIKAISQQKEVSRCTWLNQFLKTKTLWWDDWIWGCLKTKACRELQTVCCQWIPQEELRGFAESMPPVNPLNLKCVKDQQHVNQMVLMFLLVGNVPKIGSLWNSCQNCSSISHVLCVWKLYSFIFQPFIWNKGFVMLTWVHCHPNLLTSCLKISVYWSSEMSYSCHVQP